MCMCVCVCPRARVCVCVCVCAGGGSGMRGSRGGVQAAAAHGSLCGAPCMWQQPRRQHDTFMTAPGLIAVQLISGGGSTWLAGPHEGLAGWLRLLPAASASGRPPAAACRCLPTSAACRCLPLSAVLHEGQVQEYDSPSNLLAQPGSGEPHPEGAAAAPMQHMPALPTVCLSVKRCCRLPSAAAGNFSRSSSIGCEHAHSGLLANCLHIGCCFALATGQQSCTTPGPLRVGTNNRPAAPGGAPASTI